MVLNFIKELLCTAKEFGFGKIIYLMKHDDLELLPGVIVL